jgi:hypothetical protein
MITFQNKINAFYSIDSPLQMATVLGGLFDVNNCVNKNLSAQIFKLILDPTIASVYNLNKTNEKFKDQSFLAKHVYPLIKSSLMNHDSYKCQETGGIPWPSRRKGNCFVGCNSGCDPNLSPTMHSQAPDCPIECRPANHSDWVKC